MSGMCNPFAETLWQCATLLGKASTHGMLFDYHGEYPCAVVSVNKGDTIQGELFQLNQAKELLEELDVYEDCYHGEPGRSLFVRCVVSVFRHDEEKEVQAWMYFWNRSVDSMQKIRDGDYRKQCS